MLPPTRDTGKFGLTIEGLVLGEVENGARLVLVICGLAALAVDHMIRPRGLVKRRGGS
ncbi:hypothetical protein [Methylobacterium sp. Leaf89]|uniref:hypothetical protein n=1 Tax=Methylobacterium sp. Leaf89 TaxID=1736245 RepID=UPI000AC2FE65|nr:hypothetical protein [Methylobacterium sp. Leaf89]